MKTRPSKKSDKIFIMLRNRIVDLEYAPGAVLSEKELCSEFNVSRTPLREVLFKLEGMKLIQTIPKFGTMVTPIDTIEIRSTYEVKVDLEMLAGSLSAERITETEIKELENIYRMAIQAAKEGNSTIEYDHQYIKTNDRYDQFIKEGKNEQKQN